MDGLPANGQARFLVVKMRKEKTRFWSVVFQQFSSNWPDV
jgi:hypothetical protein